MRQRLQAAAGLSSALSRARWQLAVGQPVADETVAERLVMLLLDDDIGAAIRSLSVIDEARDLLLLLGPLSNCRAVFDPRIAGSRPQPAEVTVEGMRRWATAVDGMLRDEFGFDPVATALLARGLDPEHTVQWLRRVGDSLSEAGSGVPDRIGATLAEVHELLGELRFPRSLYEAVTVDRCAGVSVARCFACDIPEDVRIVVPDDPTWVGGLRTLTHEFGHVIYFRAAPGVGECPGMFEPAAAGEAMGFCLEYVASVLRGGSLAVLLSDVRYSVRAAEAELLLRSGADGECDLEAVNAGQFLSPWSTLDYALAKITAVAVARGANRSGPKDIGRMLLDHLVLTGPRFSWAQRHNALVRALEEVDLLAPTADAGEIVRYREER